MKDYSNIIFHSLSRKDALSVLKTDAVKGLKSEEVANRLQTFGNNSISQKENGNIFTLLLAQFKSPIALLLLIAAGLSFWFGEWMDALAILIVLIINSLIGFYMEFQAGRSMDALKKMSTACAKVIRNGQLNEINSEEIVPGDIAYVEAGDLIPADGRIVSLSQLQSDESPLTGESVPVEKQQDKVASDTPLAERSNMLYKGTFVSKGNGYLAVTGTGMNTELGKVASLVQSADQSVTPLEKKLQEFSKKLITITVILVVIIFVAGLIDGQKFVEMLETSIALAVAAIPEGLPIVATMALAQGMIKMARQKVIVKKLSAVETLGGTTVICTDKTGTLTKNKIEVAKVVPASESLSEIIAEVCILCNTAELYLKNGEEQELGDPLEVGLLKYAIKKGFNINDFRSKNPKIKEEPFSSETKIMSTLHKSQSGLTVYSKGAAEELLNRCNRIANNSGTIPCDAANRFEWLNQAEKLASSGLRIIGVAYRKVSSVENNLSTDLIFLGLIGMIDPPREDVFAAIGECRTAGITIIMITGDHPATASNIATQLKITDSGKAKVVLGKEMKDYTDLSREERMEWANARIFARVSPKQKLDIVKVFQEEGNVVAMTGDGINDAPALKKADIGVAMGKRGTQVAQEVANMILKDDSFSSIVLAIRQGRIIFDNIRKFVIYLLSCNLSELLVVSLASLFNLHFQLFPLQILFINLITDVLPALALGVTSGSNAIMKLPPRNINEPIIDRQRWKSIFSFAIIISVASIGSVFVNHYTVHNTELWNHKLCNNILFMTLIFSQLLHVFNMNNNSPFFRSEIMRSKYVWGALILSSLVIILCYLIAPVRKALSIHELSSMDWLIASGASLASLVLIQFFKTIKLIKY